MDHSEHPDEISRIREAIKHFLAERLQPKLDKLKPDDIDARLALIQAHQPSVWVADAAKRVLQIQLVTHPVKFTHPSAGGSSLYYTGNTRAGPLHIGSHSLGGDFAVDVVGNAAALDVYKFLRVEVDGRSLLERAINRDSAFVRALGDDTTQASQWVEAFAALPQIKGPLSSHKLAKQVYWPLQSGEYHLLSPLLSSPLAHALHGHVLADRFSDEARAARDARRDKRPHASGYRDYPNIAIQKFGGSRPQNVSSLNLDRRGENVLLASLPPRWEVPPLRLPLKSHSVFTRFYPYRPNVRRLVGVLKAFLRSVANRRSNVAMRYTRAALVVELVDELLTMAAELQRGVEPGWTAHPDCHLGLSEQRWLDPGRAMIDEAFAAGTSGERWKDEVCRGFANWLNTALTTDRALFGEAEAREWEKVIGQELALLREEVSDD